tara:strand:- start:58 stop:810 length:753 start_codon:yes stop_codon:yes gene_type:complete
MPTITFHANKDNIYTENPSDPPDLIHHDEGSGLGFFGGGFGISVPVGSYQDATYVTNANGTASGIQASNIKFDTTTTGFVQGETEAQAVSGIPNIAAPLNIRFEHTEGVKVQNCKIRIFDRLDITKSASGVTTQVYEIRHPNPVAGVEFDDDNGPLRFRGTVGENQWELFDETTPGQDLVLTPGPGPSGLNTDSADVLAATDGGGAVNWISQSGNACRATRHDWYVALSASPDSIGSKTDFGLYFTLEYL